MAVRRATFSSLSGTSGRRLQSWPPSYGTISGATSLFSGYLGTTFLSNGTLIIQDAGFIEFMIVGGGGAGGGASNSNSESGYGGQVYIGSSYFLKGSYSVTVGNGASGQVWPNTPQNGSSSSIIGNNINLIALGGSAGQASFCCPSDTRVPATGAWKLGQTVSSFTGSYIAYSVTGSNIAVNTSPINASANTGSGGSNTWSSANTAGGNGGSGIVVVRYPIL